MLILAIDPGPQQSAWILYDTTEKRIIDMQYEENDMMLDTMQTFRDGNLLQTCVIEDTECYGMEVGQSVFDTCWWSGRFVERWFIATEKPEVEVHTIKRTEVKLHLCNSRRATMTNIRRALADRFGGSIRASKGTKKQPGPLYGVGGDHFWSALAVAVVFAERLEDQRRAKKQC